MSQRNNEDRLGATAQADLPAAVVQQSETFSFAPPTEFVELPSGGRFYPEGLYLRDVETIEIKYMTAKDEDILTSRSLIKKGLAIERLLKNIIIDKKINTDDMLVGDKNAVIIAARSTGYGSDYVTGVSCPACHETIQHEFNLEELDMRLGGVTDFLSEEHSVREAEKVGCFVIPLPVTKAEIEVRLLTGADEKNILKKNEKRKKHKLPEAGLTSQLKSFICSVNGDTSAVNNFVDNMPAKDSKHLRLVYQKLVPNVDMKHDFECSECQYFGNMEVPLTAEFFWPK